MRHASYREGGREKEEDVEEKVEKEVEKIEKELCREASSKITREHLMSVGMKRRLI